MDLKIQPSPPPAALSPLGVLLAALSPVDRQAFAASASSTLGYLRHVARGRRNLTLGLADALVAAAKRLPAGSAPLSLDDLPLTASAAQQRALREGKITFVKLTPRLSPAVKKKAAVAAKKHPPGSVIARGRRFAPY